MFCMKCGKEIDDLVKICPNCGEEINVLERCERENEKESSINLQKEIISEENIENNNPDDMIGKNKESTLRAMIGDNIDHYIRIFKEIEKGGDGGATGLGFIAPCWFLYRKMYIHFFVLVGIKFLVTGSMCMGVFINIGIDIYLVINMRKMYYKFVVDTLEKNNLTGEDVNDDKKYLRLIKRIGQTSYATVAIYLVAIRLFIQMIWGMTYNLSVICDMASDLAQNEYQYEYTDNNYISTEESNKVETRYKNSCNMATYDELMTGPDVYYGLPLVLTGEVIQIVEDEESTLFRICITENSDGWEDPILVEYNLTDQLEYQTDFWVLEDDIVTLWGDSEGLITYESTEGDEVTVPGITVRYMDLVR